MDTIINPKLVVIVGPTCSGKTALALEIARRNNGEIICADSRTVYKGLDIGTAKPTLKEQQAVKHHLIDIIDPNQKFTAAEFKILALKAISDIHSRGKLPIMVGGTGLYIDSVIFDYNFGEPADPVYRKYLSGLDVGELQNICRQNNIALPENSLNKRHLVRAIELNGLNKREELKLREKTIVVGITSDRQILRDRISLRVKKMFDSSVIQEARRAAKKFGWDNESMTGNIYPIVHRLLNGEITKEEAVQENIQSDMRLAKRQITWFKRNPYIFWSNDSNVLINTVESWLNGDHDVSSRSTF